MLNRCDSLRLAGHRLSAVPFSHPRLSASKEPRQPPEAFLLVIGRLAGHMLLIGCKSTMHTADAGSALLEFEYTTTVTR
jgi:hypothetical protein